MPDSGHNILHFTDVLECVVTLSIIREEAQNLPQQSSDSENAHQKSVAIDEDLVTEKLGLIEEARNQSEAIINR